jgi:hypothetical protein
MTTAAAVAEHVYTVDFKTRRKGRGGCSECGIRHCYIGAIIFFVRILKEPDSGQFLLLRTGVGAWLSERFF